MRKEKDLMNLASEEEITLVRKGTRINSILQRIKILSKKREDKNDGLSPVFGVDDEDETHISFPAEDSEGESHSVEVMGPEGHSGSEGFEEDEREESIGLDGDNAQRVIVEIEVSKFLSPENEILEDVEPKVENRSANPEQEFEANHDISQVSELPVNAPDFVLNFDEHNPESPEWIVPAADDPDAVSEQAPTMECFDQSVDEVEHSAGSILESTGFTVSGDDQNIEPEYDIVRENCIAEEPEGIMDYGQFESGEMPVQSNINGRKDDVAVTFSNAELKEISSLSDFVGTLKSHGVKKKRLSKSLRNKVTLRALQGECVKLQQSVAGRRERVIVIFEGMELSGKHDTIRKFTKYMDPRSTRVVSLRERTQDEKQDWYFQRYTKHLPKPGEMVFFNRSWYDRGVAEPVHGLCTEEEYGHFLSQAPEFEYGLIENGYKLIKIWLSVSAKGQHRRFRKLAGDPLKNWKLYPFDESYLERWGNGKKYRDLMFSWTDKDFSPWMVASMDKRNLGIAESMRHVLSTLDYEGKDNAEVSLTPDAKIVKRFHRSIFKTHGS